MHSKFVVNIPHHQILSTVDYAEDENGEWVFVINLDGRNIPLSAESAVSFSKRLDEAVRTMNFVKDDERKAAR